MPKTKVRKENGDGTIRADSIRELTKQEQLEKDILSELEQAFDIHEALGSYLGGVHFELTGDDVTECIGGARNLTEEDLQRAYRSQVDPRLNYEQALEMALRIARRMGRGADLYGV